MIFSNKYMFFTKKRRLSQSPSKKLLTQPQKPRPRKIASPRCFRHSTADFSLQEGGAKKNRSKRNADQGISRSAERAKGYSPLTSQAFEKA